MNPEGNKSVTCIPVPLFGPSLVTVIEKITLFPTTGDVLSTDLPNRRSTLSFIASLKSTSPPSVASLSSSGKITAPESGLSIVPPGSE